MKRKIYFILSMFFIIVAGCNELLPGSSVLFYLNGGHIDGVTETVKVKGKQGTPLTPPSDPQREGYKFVGWDQNLPATFPEKTTTFVAQWKKIVTVTFDLNGGNIDGKTDRVVLVGLAGEKLIPPEGVKKNELLLKSWGQEFTDTFPEDDRLFVAHWGTFITVTFDLEGGCVGDNSEKIEISGKTGEPLVAPKNIEREFFDFKGWNHELPTTIPNRDCTFRAQWQHQMVTVTFSAGYNQEFDTSALPLPILCEKGSYLSNDLTTLTDTENFKFKGWKIDGLTPVDSGAYQIIKDITLVAQWHDPFSLTFYAKGEQTLTIRGIVLTSASLPTETSIEYSLDEGQTWDYIGLDHPVSFGGKKKLLLRDISPSGTGGYDSAGLNFKFGTHAEVQCFGDIRTLVDWRNPLEADTSRSSFCGLFSGCTVLTHAPELPATTLAHGCYRSMFSGCTHLTQAPELPATILAHGCYRSMFSGCTGLTQAPELPATQLASSCYWGMFSGCTGLTQAPELPATQLTEYCYYEIFYGCTGLTQAPELPATTLARNCYSSMFDGCTSLTQAPELPATQLTEYCYYEIFYGCTTLSSVTMLATSFTSTSDDSHFGRENCVSSWLDNTAAKGTLYVANEEMKTHELIRNHIPEGWSVEVYQPQTQSN